MFINQLSGNKIKRETSMKSTILRHSYGYKNWEREREIERKRVKNIYKCLIKAYMLTVIWAWVWLWVCVCDSVCIYNCPFANATNP